ncbi:MAG: hypothetical protein ACC656_00175, partial [Candidatus Heimdallarchaeota archaeon]
MKLISYSKWQSLNCQQTLYNISKNSNDDVYCPILFAKTNENDIDYNSFSVIFVQANTINPKTIELFLSNFYLHQNENSTQLNPFTQLLNKSEKIKVKNVFDDMSIEIENDENLKQAFIIFI